jgi:hypothetical protein
MIDRPKETMILYVHSESSWDVVLDNWIRTFQFTEKIKIYEDVDIVNQPVSILMGPLHPQWTDAPFIMTKI